MSLFMSHGVADSPWKPLEITGSRSQHGRDIKAGQKQIPIFTKPLIM
jgi:hypothetical protein